MTGLTVWTTQGSLLFPVASRHSDQSYKAEWLNVSLYEWPFLSRHCGNAGIITVLFTIYVMEETEHDACNLFTTSTNTLPIKEEWYQDQQDHNT